VGAGYRAGNGPVTRRYAGRAVIDEVDQKLSRWVEEVLPGANVTLEGPAGADDDVGLYLFEMADLPPARGDSRPPLQVRLGYLVTTSGGNVAVAHKRLGTLLFAALTHPDWDVRYPGDIAEFWRAVGEPPRAGFILNVPLRQPVAIEPPPPVQAPLSVDIVGLRVMEGIVLGPGDVPISDAFVQLPALALTTRSDARGRFRFPGIPETPAKQQLRVRAKAREFPFTIDSSQPSPYVLRLDLAKV
jgi:hypothetical protein